jgi:hypothetical protein
MLGSARLQTLVWTADRTRAQVFYSECLGLKLKGESHGALVYDVGGGDLRVSPVPSTEPSAHTVLGFAVEDIDSIVDEFEKRALKAERFPNFSMMSVASAGHPMEPGSSGSETRTATSCPSFSTHKVRDGSYFSL